MRSKVLMTLCGVFFVFGLLGCTTTSSDSGSAPVINTVTVGTSESDASALTHVSAIKLTADNKSIFIGVNVSDTDKDISKVSISTKQNGNILNANGKPATMAGDFSTKGQEPYTGMLARLNMGGMTGTGYTIEVYFTDKKGNKSNVVNSDVFVIEE
jgi:hypothetical protein